MGVEEQQARDGMTAKMRAAVDLLRGCEEPWAAVTVTQPTRPIRGGRTIGSSAFVNLRTARALTAAGLLDWSGSGPDVDPTLQSVCLKERVERTFTASSSSEGSPGDA